METEIEIQVRSTHIDFLGHVNNAVYLEFMEWGRTDWYEKIGEDFEGLLDDGIAVVVVNIDINFNKEIMLGEKVRVRTIPLQKNNKSYKHKQEIYNEDNELVADAVVTEVLLDRNKGEAIYPTETIVEQFD